MSRKYFIICVVGVFWTVLQTSFHLVFVVFSYYLAICEKRATDENTIFLYLTYLYNSGCSKPELIKDNGNASISAGYLFKFVNKFYFESETSTTLEEVVEALLKNLDVFPTSAQFSSRTTVFLLCFIILDGAWLVSAVSLLMGTCFGIKESLSLCFYLPWLILTICVSIFDATATVFFTFDIFATTTFSDWLKFVGITQDPPQLSHFSTLPLSITAAPSLTLGSVSARFIVIWITNWICVFFVARATVFAYRESYKNETLNQPRALIESPVVEPGSTILIPQQLE